MYRHSSRALRGVDLVRSLLLLPGGIHEPDDREDDHEHDQRADHSPPAQPPADPRVMGGDRAEDDGPLLGPVGEKRPAVDSLLAETDEPLVVALFQDDLAVVLFRPLHEVFDFVGTGVGNPRCFHLGRA